MYNFLLNTIFMVISLISLRDRIAFDDCIFEGRWQIRLRSESKKVLFYSVMKLAEGSLAYIFI